MTREEIIAKLQAGKEITSDSSAINAYFLDGAILLWSDLKPLLMDGTLIAEGNSCGCHLSGIKIASS